MQARADSMEAAVAELVDNGTITQEIADKLPELKVTDKNKEGQALTDDQRTALQEEENTVYESKIADLVDAGTITQDQADQLLSDDGHQFMGPGGGPGHRGEGSGFGPMLPETNDN